MPLQEAWETKSGQHMMWNGVFGALLFLNDHEYMGANRSAFFSNTSLPLLEGLLDWWACYLVKTPCSPPGTAGCPAGGYRYDDANDAVNEGSKTLNSQMGLAFVARGVRILASDLGYAGKLFWRAAIGESRIHVVNLAGFSRLAFTGWFLVDATAGVLGWQMHKI